MIRARARSSWLRAALPVGLAGAALLLAAAPVQAASSITGASYDAEVTADAQAELPGSVAIRIDGNLDQRDHSDETVVGFVLDAEGASCSSDAAEAFDDAFASSSQIALDDAGAFSEAAVLEDVASGAYVLCAYVFDDGGDTHATGRYNVSFGAGDGSAGVDDGSSQEPGSGEDDAAFDPGEDSENIPSFDDDDPASEAVCSFSRAPKKATRKLTLSCPDVEGEVTLFATTGGKLRTVTLTLIDGKARVQAKRLGLSRKRSTRVSVEQGDLLLAEVKLKLRR